MNEATEKKEPFKIDYNFTFKDGSEQTFNIRLNNETLQLEEDIQKPYPEWANLDFHKCPHCPLDSKTTQHCPIALNLTNIIEFFKKIQSIERVDVKVITEQRSYTKSDVDIQKPIGALIGIYMVSSGCPIMDKLRPMVRFHLPFANPDETTYRALSMYLMAQFFVYKQKGEPDWDMKNLGKIYDDVKKVNIAFCERLRELKIDDASLNAIVILDCFAQSVSYSIEFEEMLNEIKNLFRAYL